MFDAGTADIRDLDDEAAFEARARSLVTSTPPGAPQVIVPHGPLAACGAFLAATLGHALVVIDSVDPKAICDLASRRPTTILLAFEATGDSIVFGLLARQDEALASRQAWAELPRFSILTARDIPALTRLVAKIVARPQSRGPQRRFRHLWSSAKRIEALEEGDGHSAPLQHPRSELVEARATIRRVLEAPADAVACSTHGTETCAMGVDGLFLCGRSLSSPITDFPVRGQLACGSGKPCLRGPEPLALRDIPAELMITSSCSSLRLAGSCLDPRFNLALSFLDGPGRAYVGSVLSGSGGEMASKLFLAAYASGHELGTSTMLVNLMLQCFGLDLASYICMGAVDMSSIARPTAELHTFETSTFEVDAGRDFLFEGLVTDPESVALAERGDLVVDVEHADTQEPCQALFRLELAHGGQLALRVIVFRFPEPLGRIRARLLDRSAIKRRAAEALQALERWNYLARVTGVLAEEADELEELLEHARGALRPFQARSWWRSGIADVVASRAASILELARDVRDRILNGLIARCAGGFWLTNAWMQTEFRNAQISRGTCPVCGSSAIERTLRNSDGALRFVVVCGRDGIMLDREAGGGILDITVRFSDVGGEGRPGYAVTVGIQRDPSMVSPIVVRAAISTPGRAEVPCRPPQVVLGGGGDSVAEFSFELDEDPLPNTHSVKVLAATDQEIAFAARKVFTFGHSISSP